MRTLVYCTAYADTLAAWQSRYRMWIEAQSRPGIQWDQLLIVDDGSPVLPAWDDVALVREFEVPDAADVRSDAPVVLYHHEFRLGRAGLFDFPGWHRSFAFGARYARAHGFDKVVHLESDAFLVSRRMRRLVDAHGSGWVIPWSERYKFPEIAIQLVGPDQLEAFAAFAARPYDWMRHRVHEPLFTPTHIERGLVGERYGEEAGPVPRDADYATQVPSQREPSYYWWLRDEDEAPPPECPAAADRVFQFGQQAGDQAGDLGLALGIGWSYPEAELCWMMDDESTLSLPPLSPGHASAVTLTLMPHVWGERLPVQRLTVLANEVPLGEFELRQEGTVGFAVPAGTWRADGLNLLRLRHPDAAAPAAVSGGGDHRRLAVAVKSMTVSQEGRPEALPLDSAGA